MNVPEVADDSELVSRWLGRTINNKYVVQHAVGNGGMAVVYAVKHRNGKRFALKMLHRELSLNPFIRQRFVREGYVANRVEHEGAVAVIDDDITDDGSAFLVMDLLHGVTLERLWEASDHRLTLECVLAIAEQLLDVLAAAHAQNIVHRDMKPANVFITRNGVVKILDFGIARLREGDGSKTESGTTLGTPLFMPPEQAAGRSRDVDGRTDLWAIGATMFSSLTGQYVHDGENAAQVLISVATTPSRSIATVMPDLPADVVHIIDKALAFHNEDRWESAVEMRSAVLQAQANMGFSISRDFLGRIVRATAPGPSNTDVQSTPVTTPAPSDPSRTERMVTPSTPSGQGFPQRSNGVASASNPEVTPSMNATKRSALAPEGSSMDRSGELSDSAARAMTSATFTPKPRASSSAVVGGVLLALVAAVGGAFLAIRFVANSADKPTPPSVATPLVSVPTPPPVVAEPVGSVQPVTDSAAEVPEANQAPSAAAARGLVKPVHRPAKAGKPTPNEPTGETPPPATAATPPPPPTTTTAPVPTNTTPHKPPPVLDRTSPFGN
jgi:serine/threonine protein kinase